MFSIVTIAREYGSGGGQIAQRLADRLGWKLLDRCLIEKISKVAQVDPAIVVEYDEHLDPWLTRLIRVFTQISGYLPGAPPEILDAHAMASLTRRVIEEAAEIGNCVIVGRGSQCIFQRRSGVFHVFIYAPRDDRLHRIRQRQPRLVGVGEALDARDRERSEYVRHFYGQDWTNRHLYNLMLTSGTGEETAVNSILQAMGWGQEQSPELPRGPMSSAK
jgi:cytidylate kinase